MRGVVDPELGNQLELLCFRGRKLVFLHNIADEALARWWPPIPAVDTLGKATFALRISAFNSIAILTNDEKLALQYNPPGGAALRRMDV